MPNTRTRTSAIAVCLVLGIAGRATAQDSLAVLVARARTLVETKQYSEARQALAEASLLCAPDAGRSPCRQVVNFERGYLAQSAAVESGGSTALIEEATAAYRAVLADAPGHEAAQQNLGILFAQMDPARLNAEQLEQAGRGDVLRTGHYRSLLGDRQLAVGDTAQARASWLQAMGQAGAGPAPVQRLLSLYAAGVGSTPEILAVLRRIQREWPETAEEGYLLVIDRTHKAAPATADTALVRWVALRAGRGDLQAETLASLPAEWRPESVVELQRYLSTCDPEISWWPDATNRRDALAHASLARGRDLLVEERLSDALACWLDGFRKTETSIAWDLGRELAQLIYHHPELDDGNALLAAVEDRLFFDKGGAIRRDDLVAQQRLHTTLGMIYVDRGQWRTTDDRRGALFQLERALRAAFRRDSVKGYYQPLPDLRLQLARGYREPGDPLRANRLLLEAAREFLDVDSPELARTALSEISSHALADSVAEVEALLAFRTRLAAWSAEGTARDSAAALCSPISLQGAAPASEQFAVPLSGLARRWSGSPFLTRQRFKILADCSEMVRDPLRQAYAAEALRIAVSGRGRGLVGGADYGRFQRAMAVVLEGAMVSSGNSVITSERPSTQEAGEVIVIGISMDDDPAYLWVSRERLVAALATRLVAPWGYELWVTNDNVVVRTGGRDVPSKTLVAQLQDIEGVAQVQISP